MLLQLSEFSSVSNTFLDLFIITRIIKVHSISMYYDSHQKELENLTIKRGNLLEIKTKTKAKEATNRTPESGPLNNKRIVYTANALRQISGLLQHDHRLKILPFGAINNIIKFKLNYKPIKTTDHNIRNTTKVDLTMET